MNQTDHLLACLIEECAEVAQRATKAQRFGIDEIQPRQAQTNAERLRDEFCDLMGVMSLLRDRGVVPELDAEKISKKRDKVLEFMVYAESRGVLQDSRSRAATKPMPEWFPAALAVAQHEDRKRSWPWFGRFFHWAFRSWWCPCCIEARK